MTIAAVRRTMAVWVWIAAAWLAVLAASASAETPAFRQGLAEAAAEDETLSAFYRGRDYTALWTTAADAGRREAFFGALDRAADHGLPPARYDAEGLRRQFRTLASERQRGRLEAAMSRVFLMYATDVRSGVIEPHDADPGIVREVLRRDPMVTLTTFAAADDPLRYIRALPPASPQYAQLMKAKRDLETVMSRGGFGPRVAAEALEPGETGAGVVQLRDRLVGMGYLAASASASYDDPMRRAVQLFQMDHGLIADGIARESTLAEVNISPEARLQSVIVAMERLRWMNGIDLGARHIWVNLPDFTAKIVDHGKVTFETVTVVGMDQSDRRSPEFSDVMEHMVINPSWHVPRSITVKEYLPMLQRNPNAAGHLRIVDSRGRVVNRNAVDFRQFNARNFPFSMSQPPSDSNALGLVKFMFPNKYNIYLHDTPSKDLFEKEVRAYSHGCIRLGRPFEFAYALLRPQTADPEGLFRTNLENKSEHLLPLEVHVPVHLVYFTAWPTPKGKVEYRRDVYGRDGRIFEALMAAGVALPEVQG